MKLFHRHQNIHSLLGQLKSSGEYPPELLKARRAQYLIQAADLGMGAGLSVKALAILKASLASTLEYILHVALSVMVAGLVITASVVYRDEILEFFAFDNGEVAVYETVPTLQPFTPSPELSQEEKIETPTSEVYYLPTVTPTASPTPVEHELDDPKNNKGLHLGQTPTPPALRKTPKP